MRTTDEALQSYISKIMKQMEGASYYFIHLIFKLHMIIYSLAYGWQYAEIYTCG
jgi:hypothetical protein